MGQRMGLRVDAVKASKQMEQDIFVRIDKKRWMKKVFVKNEINFLGSNTKLK
jgi:hypothetical protein